MMMQNIHCTTFSAVAKISLLVNALWAWFVLVFEITFPKPNKNHSVKKKNIISDFKFSKWPKVTQKSLFLMHFYVCECRRWLTVIYYHLSVSVCFHDNSWTQTQIEFNVLAIFRSYYTWAELNFERNRIDHPKNIASWVELTRDRGKTWFSQI